MKTHILIPTLVCILSLFLFIPHVVSYGESNQAELYSQQTFTKYQESVVYVYAEKIATGNKTKGIFFPVVDEFSQLNLLGTGLEFKDASEVAVYANIHGFITPYRFYKHQKTPGFLVGSLTLTITLLDGKLDNAYWADSCDECSLDRCVDEKNCGLTYDELSCTDKFTCNVMIYLAWVGTDANGQPCRSYSFTPQRFSRFSLVPAYKSAANITNEQFFSGRDATNAQQTSLFSLFQSLASMVKNFIGWNSE